MPCLYVTVGSESGGQSLGNGVGEAWKMNEEPGMGLWEDTNNQIHGPVMSSGCSGLGCNIRENPF